MTPHRLLDSLLSSRIGDQTSLYLLPSTHHRDPMSLIGSPGIYVPVHKRTGSSPSLTTPPSSPRSPSLSGMFYQFRSQTAAYPTRPEHTHTRIYPPEFMLSLRPNADESVKENIRETCPEVVMSRRTREFSQQREAVEMNAFHHNRHPPLPQATAITALLSAPTTASPSRIIPRRAGRATERRRQALQSIFAWRERVIAPFHSLPVVQLNTSP